MKFHSFKTFNILLVTYFVLSSDALTSNPTRLGNNLLTPKDHASNDKSISWTDSLVTDEQDGSNDKKEKHLDLNSDVNRFQTIQQDVIASTRSHNVRQRDLNNADPSSGIVDGTTGGGNDSLTSGGSAAYASLSSGTTGTNSDVTPDTSAILPLAPASSGFSRQISVATKSLSTAAGNKSDVDSDSDSSSSGNIIGGKRLAVKRMNQQQSDDDASGNKRLKHDDANVHSAGGVSNNDGNDIQLMDNVTQLMDIVVYSAELFGNPIFDCSSYATMEDCFTNSDVSEAVKEKYFPMEATPYSFLQEEPLEVAPLFLEENEMRIRKHVKVSPIQEEEEQLDEITRQASGDDASISIKKKEVDGKLRHDVEWGIMSFDEDVYYYHVTYSDESVMGFKLDASGYLAFMNIRQLKDQVVLIQKRGGSWKRSPALQNLITGELDKKANKAYEKNRNGLPLIQDGKYLFFKASNQNERLTYVQALQLIENGRSRYREAQHTDLYLIYLKLFNLSASVADYPSHDAQQQGGMEDKKLPPQRDNGGRIFNSGF